MTLLVYRYLIFLCCCLFCPVAGSLAETVVDSPDQIWQVRAHHWEEEDEQRFAAWIESTITEDFFIRYNIPVDCADVPYAIRWIYARIAHLPAAGTMPDGRLFGNWSTAWKNLPTDKDWYRDQRFRMALMDMLARTSTRTLSADTYPIRITRDSVLAGTVFIENGHAGIVGNIVLDGSTFSPVQTWEGTLPRKITKLRQENYFAAQADIQAGTGLVRFRWPIYSGGRWRYEQKQQQPFYSLEQYGPEFNHIGTSFAEEVARRIDPTPYQPAERVALIIKSIYGYLKTRASLVQEGYRHCQHADCSEDSYLWEVYSTPGRDDRIAFEIEQLEKLIKDNNLDEKAFKKTTEGNVIHIDRDQTVTLNYVIDNYPWLSHDPEDSIEARWGLRRCDMVRDGMRDTLQALDFVVQRYGSTDPVYADSRRNMDLRTFNRLQQDGQRFGCNELPPLPGR